MPYLTVNKHGVEKITQWNPIRNKLAGWWTAIDNGVTLPNGTIEKIIGKKLTWRHNPVLIK